MIYTTLRRIMDEEPCEDSWKKLLKHLGKTVPDDDQLSLLTILDSNGLEDALWSLRCTDVSDSDTRLLACDFAERALRFVPDGEDRPRLAIEAARAHASGEISDEELTNARSAVIDTGFETYRYTVDAEIKKAVWAVSRNAAWNTERSKQEEIFRRFLEGRDV
jgi:hypothetical protein